MWMKNRLKLLLDSFKTVCQNRVKLTTKKGEKKILKKSHVLLTEHINFMFFCKNIC